MLCKNIPKNPMSSDRAWKNTKAFIAALDDVPSEIRIVLEQCIDQLTDAMMVKAYYGAKRDVLRQQAVLAIAQIIMKGNYDDLLLATIFRRQNETPPG